MAFLTNCTCCGKELENVQFYNGNAYGSTCVLRVDPQYKVNKNANWIKTEYKVFKDGVYYVVKLAGKWHRCHFGSKAFNLIDDNTCFYNDFKKVNG